MPQTFESMLRADRSEVWAAISTVGGINREVAPLMRMTDSTDGAPFDTEPWTTSSPVLWQLLFGVIPVDRHRVELAAFPDGGGFRESSSSWWHRVWWHERTLLDDPGGCIVRDVVEVEARLRWLRPIVRRSVDSMMRRRQRRLQQRFG